MRDQAASLVDLLHADTRYARGELILEAGCGVGAQTMTLAQNNPAAQFISVDSSAASLDELRRRLQLAHITNVRVQQADIFALPFAPQTFNHVFVCFVLEHLAQPIEALRRLSRFIKPGGTLTVIEGDHGSAYFSPDSSAARAAIACQIALQQRAGGDALIGRRLYPLLVEAGLDDVAVAPKLVYVDGSRPNLAESFTRKTFTAMIAGIRETAIAANMTTPEAFDAGIHDLYRTAEKDGVFCYCFFQAIGRA